MLERVFEITKAVGTGQKRMTAEFAWIFAGQLVSTFGALVGVRVLTELLPPEKYGELALALSLANLAQLVILGPLSNGITRFFAPSIEAAQVRRFSRVALRLLFFGYGITLGSGLLLLMVLWFAGFGNRLLMAGLTLGFCILSSANSVLDSAQNIVRQRKIAAFHQAVGTWLRFGLAVVWIKISGSSSVSAMMGYASACVPVLFSQIYLFNKKILQNDVVRNNIQGQEDWARLILSYSRPFFIWGILAWLLSASDRWALQFFGSTKDVGCYAVLYQIGYYPLSILSGLLNQLLAPVFFAKAGVGTDQDRMKQVYDFNRVLDLVWIFLVLVAFLIAALFHRLIFDLLSAPDYRGFSFLLPFMVAAGGLFAGGQLASMAVMSRANPDALIAPKVVLSLSGVILNGLGCYFFQTTGLVLMMVLNNLVFFIWMVQIRKHSSRPC